LESIPLPPPFPFPSDGVRPPPLLSFSLCIRLPHPLSDFLRNGLRPMSTFGLLGSLVRVLVFFLFFSPLFHHPGDRNPVLTRAFFFVASLHRFDSLSGLLSSFWPCVYLHCCHCSEALGSPFFFRDNLSSSCARLMAFFCPSSFFGPFGSDQRLSFFVAVDSSHPPCSFLPHVGGFYPLFLCPSLFGVIGSSLLQIFSSITPQKTHCPLK